MLFVLSECLLMVVAITMWLLDDCCCFQVPFGWLLLFPRAFWMVAIIPSCLLDGCCYSLCLLDVCCYVMS